MNQTKIILLCVAAAVSYGVLHDQVTARLCLEYFTVAHPPLFSVASPTMLALCWGVAATGGIGLVLGVLLALVAHSGGEPPLGASRLFAPIARLLATTALAALLGGICGFLLAKRGMISLPATFLEVIPSERQDRFMAAWFSHGASYLVGLAGAALLVLRIWRERGRSAVISLLPESRTGVVRAAIVVALAAYILWLRFRTR